MSIPARRLAYCLASYPVLREYFNHVEIEGLRDQGWDVHVFTFVDRSPAATAEWGVRWDRVHRAPWHSPRTWGRALREALRQPGRTVNMATLIVRRLARSPLNLAKALAVLGSALALASVVRRLEIEVLHGAWSAYPGLLALALHRLCPECRFTFGSYAYDYDWRFPLTVDMAQEADLVFTHSNARARQFREEWPRTSRPVVVVYRGVELGERVGTDERRGIVTVGGLVRYKGLHVLIEALARLRARGITTDLTVVGGPSEEEPGVERELGALARARGVGDHVRLTGAVAHSVVLDLVRHAAVFCLPSLYNDSLPNAVKEAMAASVPVVVTDSVGIEELVEDGLTGRVVPRGDAVALEAALGWVFEHPTQAAEMAARGRQRLEARFDLRRTSEQRSALFTALLTPEERPGRDGLSGGSPRPR